MSIIASLFMLGGSLLALLAGIGLLRFKTPYARFHASGKASPIAFLVVSVGAGLELGLSGAGYLIVASTAMMLTLPVGVHLVFRASHRSVGSPRLSTDELRDRITQDSKN